MALAMCLAMMLIAVIFASPMRALAANYQNTGYYWWNDSTKQWELRTAYAEVLDDIDSSHYTLNSGWYVMKGDWGDGDRPTVSGTVNLIIENGCDVHLRDGIHVPPGSTLNIYGQSGNTGKFKVDRSKADTAAIGGNSGESSGTINIYGGDLNVRGGSHTNHGGAGIGGGWKGSGTVNIYGGTIKARGGNEAAGIGGGSNKDGFEGGGGASNNIKIYGGTVSAEGWWGAGIGGGEYGKGGTIQIFGGDVTAVGGADAAGIGGGEERDGGNITISGGNVKATGGSLTNKGGAGIGGGGKGESGTIAISGGTVKAAGGAFASGIGGGDEAEGKNITISGGNVTATGSTQNSNGCGGAAGIGGGDKAAGKNITISGGTVSATGGTKTSVFGGAGIGGGSNHNGENISISGSANITKAQGGADAAGIGGGNDGEGNYITISGGTVKAQGGSDNDGGGAGIGGGQNKSGRVEISGGTVTATGGADGAGIGGGEKGGAENIIKISNGTVTATGGDAAAGIGGGEDTGGGTITISGDATITAKGGQYGAGIGGGDEGENAGTILIQGGSINASGGEGASGIGGGYKGGRAGTITIQNGKVTATGGHTAAGIGTGRWSHTHGDAYYSNAVSVTITGGTVDTTGGAGGAGIGGGWLGPSGKIVIGTLGSTTQPTVNAKGGRNGGTGIGSGSGCSHSDYNTVDVTINGGTVTATAGFLDSSTNNTEADPGTAIGTGACENAVSIGGVAYESYFVGKVELNGGHVYAYGADITKSTSTKAEKLNVIGTTSKENDSWNGKGKVIFNGATVDMYPGNGTTAVKQMVRAIGDSNAEVVSLRDVKATYQRVTFITQDDKIDAAMKEAKLDYRTLVLTGAEDIEEYGGTKLENAEYRHIHVEPVHKHEFTYSTGTTTKAGDTIIATCVGGEGCSLDNTTYNKQAKLILSKPPHEEYGDGKDAGVVITDENHIGNANVVYYKANPDETKEDGDPLDPDYATVPPKDPGAYWAEITLDGTDEGDATAGENKATAHVVYTIDKAQPTLTNTATIDEANESKTIDLSANVQNVPNEASITYILDNSDSLLEKGIEMLGSVLRIPPSSQSDSNIGSVEVHVNFAGDDNYKPLNDSITVTINRRPRPTIQADAITMTVGDTKPMSVTVAGDGTHQPGQVTYSARNKDEWDTDNVITVDASGNITALKAGEAIVTVTVAATADYAATSMDVPVTVTRKQFPAGIAARDYEGIYDGHFHGITMTGVPNNAEVYYATEELSEENYSTEGIPASAISYAESLGEFVTFKNAGTHTVYYYVTAPNYEPVTGSATVTINKRPVAVTISALDKEYDGTDDATVTAALAGDNRKGAIDGEPNSGLVDGESIDILGVTGRFADKNAGENKQVFVDYSAVSFYGDNPDNYEATSVNEPRATISKAWATVMAEDVYVPVSEPLPEELTAYAYAAVEGEEIEYSLSCNAQAGVIGEYEIKVFVDPTIEPNCNYDVWCVNGTLTVTQSLSVTASGYTGVYDGKPHSITVNVKAPNIDAGMTIEGWIALVELAEWAGYEFPPGYDGWTVEQWAEWARSVNLEEALANLEWATVYYSTEELNEENFMQVASTTNPTFTDVGTYPVYYAVIGLDGETIVGSQNVVIDKAVPSVTAPTPVAGLHQTGEPQALVTAGSAVGGTMEYSLDGETWSENAPVASEAGPYTVFYRVIGDSNHKDVAVRTVVSTIANEEEHIATSTARMYRLYNPNSGEHFYTADEDERDYLSVIGWRYEGTGWIAPIEGTPVYRLYNPNAGDHHYTMDVAERDYLVSVGWNDEGVGWNSAGTDGVPLWRQYNPNAVAGAHNYTTGEDERDSLVSVGWRHEGVGWYGLRR